MAYAYAKIALASFIHSISCFLLAAPHRIQSSFVRERNLAPRQDRKRLLPACPHYTSDKVDRAYTNLHQRTLPPPFPSCSQPPFRESNRPRRRRKEMQLQKMHRPIAIASLLSIGFLCLPAHSLSTPFVLYMTVGTSLSRTSYVFLQAPFPFICSTPLTRLDGCGRSVNPRVAPDNLNSPASMILGSRATFQMRTLRTWPSFPEEPLVRRSVPHEESQRRRRPG